MMKNNVILLVLAIVIVLVSVLTFLIGRPGRTLAEYKKRYDRPPLLADHEHWVRDSTLLAFAVAERENDYMEWYENRNDQRMARINPDDVVVGEILYSSDELRMVGLVGFPRERDREARNYKRRQYDHLGRAYVGTRSSLTDPWELYPLDVIMLHGFGSSEEAVISARYSHFETVTGRKEMSAGDDAMDSMKLYNVDDERFWTSDLWTIGSRSDGVYPFQVRLGPTNRDPRWIPVQPLVKEYPDWIVGMYEPARESP